MSDSNYSSTQLPDYIFPLANFPGTNISINGEDVLQNITLYSIVLVYLLTPFIVSMKRCSFLKHISITS